MQQHLRSPFQQTRALLFALAFALPTAHCATSKAGQARRQASQAAQLASKTTTNFDVHGTPPDEMPLDALVKGEKAIKMLSEAERKASRALATLRKEGEVVNEQVEDGEDYLVSYAALPAAIRSTRESYEDAWKLKKPRFVDWAKKNGFTIVMPKTTTPTTANKSAKPTAPAAPVRAPAGPSSVPPAPGAAGTPPAAKGTMPPAVKGVAPVPVKASPQVPVKGATPPPAAVKPAAPAAAKAPEKKPAAAVPGK